MAAIAHFSVGATDNDQWQFVLNLISTNGTSGELVLHDDIVCDGRISGMDFFKKGNVVRFADSSAILKLEGGRMGLMVEDDSDTDSLKKLYNRLIKNKRLSVGAIWTLTLP